MVQNKIISSSRELVDKISANKYTPYVLGGIGIVVASIIIYRKATKKTTLNTLGSNLSNDEAKVVAESQFGFMNKLGTADIQTMIKGLENLNKGDLRKVYNAFGTRCYNGYTECVLLDKYLGGRNLDLFGWYSEELSDSERESMRGVWSKSEIPLTF